MGRDVLEEIDALRRRRHNLKHRELESVAKAAGWMYDRTTGSHVIYAKAGVREPLSIPRHSTLKGFLALRLLNQIEDSIIAEEGGHDEP